MKYNLRAVLGTAVVAVAVVAGMTGCGSLANNAAGLERDAGVRGNEAREYVREHTNNRHLTHRGHNRHQRRVNEMTNERNVHRQGVAAHRENAQRRYLQHEDLTLQNGRFVGDGANPATDMRHQTNYAARHQNHVRDLAHRNYETDVVGTDGVVRQNASTNVTNRTNRTHRANHRSHHTNVRTHQTNRAPIGSEQGITIS